MGSKRNKFLYSASNLAVAILMVIAIIAVVIVAISLYLNSKEQAMQRQKQLQEQTRLERLAIPKNWPALTIGPLEDSEFRLSSIWRDDKLHYQFVMDGYPQKIKDAMMRKRSDPHFTITFLDENGFRCHSIQIQLHEMSRRVDQAGNPVGLTALGESYLNVDRYEECNSWQLSWALK